MKKTLNHYGFCLLIFGLLFGISTQMAVSGSYFTVSGTVKDKSDRKKLDYVTVSIPGTGIGTVTNEDGYFSLKVNDSVLVNALEFSHLGYYNMRISVSGEDMLNQTFYLSPNPKVLKEVVIQSWADPRDLIREALSKVESNYSDNPTLLTGFYRETAEKGRNYIDISEAIIHVYKSSYSNDSYNDRVRVFKGRRLLSQKKSDTLAVKLLGGPNLPVSMDFVKNPDALFDIEHLEHYKFKEESPAVLNDRLHYVVKFEPQMTVAYPLFRGTVYIDRQTLAFTQAEFSLDMKDKEKVTNSILKQKPRGLRFKPEEVSFFVAYKQCGDRTCLNYIRNEIRFKCDWKRRLFATGYTVLSEVVMTASEDRNIESIPRKEAFNPKESLRDKVSDFYDDDFWGDYNILEPTESLESAVNKLKKQR